MTRQAYLESFHNICFNLLKLTESKNRDYANGADAFQNFSLVEKLGIATVEQGILTRMSDKFQRVANLIEKAPAVKGESIEDTLADLATYSILLLIYLRDKSRPPPEEQGIQDLVACVK